MTAESPSRATDEVIAPMFVDSPSQGFGRIQYDSRSERENDAIKNEYTAIIPSPVGPVAEQTPSSSGHSGVPAVVQSPMKARTMRSVLPSPRLPVANRHF